MFGKTKDSKLKITDELTRHECSIGTTSISVKSNGEVTILKGASYIRLTAQEWEAIDEFRYKKLRKEY